MTIGVFSYLSYGLLLYIDRDSICLLNGKYREGEGEK